jgi:hypothetical protein
MFTSFRQLFPTLQNGVFWLPWKLIYRPLLSNRRLFLLISQAFSPHVIIRWDCGYIFIKVTRATRGLLSACCEYTYVVVTTQFWATRCYTSAPKHNISEGNTNWKQYVAKCNEVTAINTYSDNWSRDSAGGIATGYRLDDREVGVRVPSILFAGHGSREGLRHELSSLARMPGS